MPHIPDIWLKVLIGIVLTAMIGAGGTWLFVSKHVNAKKNLPVTSAAKSEKNGEKQNPPDSKASLPVDALPIRGVVTNAKVVALTFDNTWENRVNPLLLFALKSNQAHATFFGTAAWLLNNRDICVQMLAEGNEIGSQGTKVGSYEGQAPAAIAGDIQKAGMQIKEISGVMPTLFRPTGWSCSEAVLKAAAAQGYKTVMWSVDSLDRVTDNREMIVGRVMQQVKPGAIIGMSVQKSSDYSAETVAVLLRRLATQGYQVVTVSELINRYGQQGLIRE